MTAVRRSLPFVLCITLALITAGCGSNGVPGGVVQAQSSTAPAILVGLCPTITPGNSSTNTNWLYPFGSGASDCTRSGPEGVPMPSAGVLKNLRLLAEGGTATNSGIMTVFVNGTASALTCTPTPAGPVQTTCSDTTHQVTVAAGDQIAIQLVVQTGQFGSIRATLEKE